VEDTRGIDSQWIGQQQDVSWIQKLSWALRFLSWETWLVQSESVGGHKNLVKMVSLLPIDPGNILHCHLHHTLDSGQNWAEVYLVNLFDKSKHASLGDPPSAGDGSSYKGFHQPKERPQFTDGILWEGKLVSCNYYKRNLSRCFNFLLDISVSSTWPGDVVWYNLFTFIQHTLCPPWPLCDCKACEDGSHHLPYLGWPHLRCLQPHLLGVGRNRQGRKQLDLSPRFELDEAWHRITHHICLCHRFWEISGF